MLEWQTRALLAALVTLTLAGGCKPAPAPPPTPGPPSPTAPPSPPSVAPAEAAPSPAPATGRASPVTSIDLAHCFALAKSQERREEARCPAFVVAEIQAAMQTCSEVGGNLFPAPSATAWTADFNGDQQSEYLFELAANVGCEGAPSVFSCGSLGCPVAMYEQHDGAWQIIGAVSEGAPESLELLPGAGKSGYRDFRTGCIDPGPCAEYSHFGWTGQGYQVTKLDVRGFDVDVTGSIHGLAGIPAGTPVLATPQQGAETLDRYDNNMEVIILGQAGDYYYVSPCNACRSGFVPKGIVSSPARGG
jgi:hypothetical protein